MKTKITIFVFFFLLTFLALPTHLSAQEKAAGDSASFADITLSDKPVVIQDHRVKKLREFLEKYNSPLADQAQTFIDQADKNDLDWKLLPSISGVESTFGQYAPSSCYNGWGYGIYQNHLTCFASYEEAITTISKALRETYINQWGDYDIYAIGRHYAASPAWAGKVNYFMNEIEPFETSDTVTQTLPISL